MATNTIIYFAWCGPGEAFSGGHMREDELIFSFELKHEEGQFADLELEIANPYVGLLAPGRPLWAWLSCSINGNVYALFYGRLVGIPDDLFGNVIKIKLVAKPQNYADQQAALAETLKVLPFFDPIFIDDKRLTDPDVVLEGYSALWHVDRATHAVTISDIIGGEDGTAAFTQNDVFYDKVQMKLAGAPLLLCEIEAEVEWTQCDHTGVFEMKTVPDLVGDPKIANGISVKSGVGPRVTFSSQEDKDPTQRTISREYKNITTGEKEDGDLMEESESITIPFYGGEITNDSESSQKADPETGQGEEYSIKMSYKDTEETPPKTPQSTGTLGGAQPPRSTNPQHDARKAKAEIAVEVQQDRKEAIYIAVRADVQPVLAQMTEDEKDLRQSLTMNSRDVVAAGAASASDGVYFPSARGQQSVEYLLMVARAHLLAGARVVEVEWECPFSMVVGLSCRMNATIEDARLPGSFVLGKIITYGMSGDGDRGEFLGKVTINCAVGNGSPFLMSVQSRAAAEIDSRAVTVQGTPVYVAEGYVDPGYQHYAGRRITAVTGDMDFEDLAFEAIGLQLPITEDQILVRHEYNDAGSSVFGESSPINELLQTGAAQLRSFQFEPVGGSDGNQLTGPSSQMLTYSAMEVALNDALSQQRTMTENQSWVEMEFKPVQDIATSIEFEASIGPLTIPKQIDLAAS